MTDSALPLLAGDALGAPPGGARLSPNFSVAEFERSAIAARHGIRNCFTAATRRNAAALCQNVLEPVRYVLGARVDVSSGLRVAALNCHPDLGGSLTSEHVGGYAADIGTLVLSTVTVVATRAETGETGEAVAFDLALTT